MYICIQLQHKPLSVRWVYASLQITPLQDFGAEWGGGGAFTPGWAYTPNFTVFVISGVENVIRIRLWMIFLFWGKQ